MQTLISEINTITILVSTLLIFLFACAVIYFLFLFQKKRYRHQREVLELREAFNHTLLQSKLEIQEQTLDHIAKELHANFSHLVSLININLAEILPQSSGDTKDSVAETKSLAKQLLSELKALSASLNTDHIMHTGFVKSLDNELTRIGKAGKFSITFVRKGNEMRLRPEHEIILYRLCQEVLNNVVKYSKAKSVVATISSEADHRILTISDDGIGFNKEQVELQRAEKESTGFINIQKRARLINSTISIDSSPGKGTTVTIRIPDPENKF